MKTNNTSVMDIHKAITDLIRLGELKTDNLVYNERNWGIRFKYKKILDKLIMAERARLWKQLETAAHEACQDVRLRFPLDYVESDGYCDDDCEAVEWKNDTCDKVEQCGLKLGRCYKKG